MGKKDLIGIIIGWCILIIMSHYFLPAIFNFLLWLGLFLALLVTLIIQLIKLIKERKSISKLRILKVTIFGLLLFLTFNLWIVDRFIEKIDWKVLYNTRMEIVEQVKRKDLNPNVNYNNEVCKLPFKFPIVSNGGNDILILRNEENASITVTFWIFRNIFIARSTHFIYTDDDKQKNIFEELIKEDAKNNWKINDSWYRIYN